MKSRTHKFQLPSSRNKFTQANTYKGTTAYIGTMTISESIVSQVEEQLETAMVSDERQVESNCDDNQCQDVVSEVSDDSETIVVIDDVATELQLDDTSSQDVVSEVIDETGDECKPPSVALVIEEKPKCDDTPSAELHQLYEDKHTIVKMTMNPLYMKRVDMKDMVSMVLSQSKMRKLENKYGWNS